jgi:hypothetical protein
MHAACPVEHAAYVHRQAFSALNHKYASGACSALLSLNAAAHAEHQHNKNDDQQACSTMLHATHELCIQQRKPLCNFMLSTQAPVQFYAINAARQYMLLCTPAHCHCVPCPQTR